MLVVDLSTNKISAFGCLMPLSTIMPVSLVEETWVGNKINPSPFTIPDKVNDRYTQDGVHKKNCKSFIITDIWRTTGHKCQW